MSAAPEVNALRTSSAVFPASWVRRSLRLLPAAVGFLYLPDSFGTEIIEELAVVVVILQYRVAVIIDTEAYVAAVLAEYLDHAVMDVD